MSKFSKFKIAVIFPYVLIVFGLIGFMASVAISVEKADLLAHPKADIFCNINPLYSCSSVITSKQSKLFGISNEVYGLGLFGGILAVGLSTLAAAKPKKWFWQMFALIMSVFSVMILYLWYQSIFKIGAICIFCTTVWFSGWTLTSALLTWCYDQKVFENLPSFTKPILAFTRRHAVKVWLFWILLLAGLTLKHFWYFYGPKLGF